mmetsp:Transcript_11633/g.36126  ORF Transcript_11633/g.36126 Transcript_11633/m.36126 type:complete len:1062 (-) Transcript_11633:132-3317(-)
MDAPPPRADATPQQSTLSPARASVAPDDMAESRRGSGDTTEGDERAPLVDDDPFAASQQSKQQPLPLLPPPDAAPAPAPQYFRMDTRSAATGERTDALIEWDAALEAFHSRSTWFRRGAAHKWVRWLATPGPPGCDADRIVSIVTQVALARVQLHKAAAAYLAEKKFYDEGYGETRAPATMELLRANLAIFERAYVVQVLALAAATRELQELQTEEVEKVQSRSTSPARVRFSESRDTRGSKSPGAGTAGTTLESSSMQHMGSNIDLTLLPDPRRESIGFVLGVAGSVQQQVTDAAAAALPRPPSAFTGRLWHNPRFRLRAATANVLNPPPYDYAPDDDRYDQAATDLLNGLVPDPTYITSSRILTLCDVLTAERAAAAAAKKGETLSTRVRGPVTPANFARFVAGTVHVKQSVGTLRHNLVTSADVEYATRPSVVVKEWREAVMRLAEACATRPLPGRPTRGDDFVEDTPTIGLDAGVPWLWRELRTLRRYHVLYWHSQMDAAAAVAMDSQKLLDPAPKSPDEEPTWKAALWPPGPSWLRIVVFFRVAISIATVAYASDVLYDGLPACDAHTYTTWGEVAACAVLILAAASSSKPFGFSVFNFVLMWASITALANPRQADDVALTLMSLRATIDMVLFLAVWMPSDSRPPIPHPHVTGSADGGALIAWQQASHKPKDLRERVLVGPRVKPSAVDVANAACDEEKRAMAMSSGTPAIVDRGASSAEPAAASSGGGVPTMLTALLQRERSAKPSQEIDGDHPSVRPVVLDALAGLPASPLRLHWAWAPNMTSGPNWVATLEMLGTVLVSVFNSFSVLFLSDALSNILTTAVDMLNGTALPAERLSLTTQTLFFIAVSIGSIVGQYAVAVSVAAQPKRDGTIAVDNQQMPCADPSRRWINTVFPTSLSISVFAVLFATGPVLALCGVAFVVIAFGMQVSLVLSNNRPQAPWWIATKLVGSTRIYAPIAFAQATNALNVFAMTGITLVLVSRGGQAASSSNDNDALKLIFILRAFGPAVSNGLAPNLIAVFIVVRKWVLAAKHAHVRHLRTRESSTSAPATTAA